jgi:hypothetical protein
LPNAIQYSKYYWHLIEEDTGFGTSENPKGHIRFEIKNQICNIVVGIQNLKPCISGFCYKCYLVSSDTNKYQVACLGDVELKNQKAFLSCSFAANNIDSTGLDIEKFNVAAIVYQPCSLTSNTGILFPLSGYKNEKTPWRNGLRSYLLPEKAKHTSNDSSDIHIQTKKEIKPKLTSNTIAKPSPELRYFACPKNSPFQYENGTGSINFSNDCKANEIWNNFMEHLNLFDNKSVYNYSTNIEPNFKDDLTFKLKNLENLLSMSFAECKPLKRENTLTRYWKINNRQLIKRILNSSDYPELQLISNYLDTSYYIYGFYVVSIENTDDSHYFLYGIPSLYGIDPKPSDLPCIWESENCNGELYGEFGYWLVRFDMINGGIV